MFKNKVKIIIGIIVSLLSLLSTGCKYTNEKVNNSFYITLDDNIKLNYDEQLLVLQTMTKSTDFFRKKWLSKAVKQTENFIFRN